MANVKRDTGGRRRAFGWGLVSGLTFGPILLGAVLAGYRVGRGGQRLRIAAAGMLVGSAVTMAWIIGSAVNSGCPTCADFVIVAPWMFGFLLVPLSAGFWFGRRSIRGFVERTVPV